MNTPHQPPTKSTFLSQVILALSFVAMSYAGYSYWQLHRENLSLSDKITQLEKDLNKSNTDLAQVTNQKNDLTNALTAESQKNQTFANQINNITNTVDTLERLRKTDPELLEKYSKVYFLNENYTPKELTTIDTKYLYTPAKPLEIHDRVWPFLKKLLDDATKNGINLQVLSAYRSFGTQGSLKSSYKVTYGAGTANQFSAEQGYSEHQLGTALDFTTPPVGATFSGFSKTDAYTWLTNNAYKYGFILSYPPNNNYYIFEPWHWRFVGLDLAQTLHNKNEYFYDMDQREINTYLVNFFNGVTTGVPPL